MSAALDQEVPTDLVTAVREIEAHAASGGWEQPAQLFALVDTADLITHEPDLAASLGLDASSAGLTPVQQDAVPPQEELESVLAQIAWPTAVLGCAAVVERLVLPPEADGTIPDDPQAAAAFAATHPERQQVRIIAGVLRDGPAYCALRLRAFDEDSAVLTGPDLVPALVRLLAETLDGTDDE